jgi:hypothetical protein
VAEPEVGNVERTWVVDPLCQVVVIDPEPRAVGAKCLLRKGSGKAGVKSPARRSSEDVNGIDGA